MEFGQHNAHFGKSYDYFAKPWNNYYSDFSQEETQDQTPQKQWENVTKSEQIIQN